MESKTLHDAVLRTLLLSDLVDSTRLVEQLGDKRTARLFARHDRLARNLMASWEGREIDKSDGFLVLFDRPWPAVRYALAYHRALAGLGSDNGVDLRARIGIHLGEVFLRENRPDDVARGAKPLEVEGLAKPLAARLTSLAGPRQTLLTQGAFDLARRAGVGAAGERAASGLCWLEHGAYSFHGVEEPVAVFEVGEEGFAPLKSPSDQAKARRLPAVPIKASPTGMRLGDRYELIARLGQGGMGVVYRAEDPVLGREVAVKMIPPSLLGAGAIERFRREARTLAQLDHPGILPIYDFGEHQGSLYLVLPLVEGATLRSWIRERRLRLGEILDVAGQLAGALGASHARRVIHRDVKPENVMLTREPHELRARLMDFGLAQEASSTRLTRSGSLLGTLPYMSPEQVGGRPIDGRADLYALGMVLYECLCGEPAFAGTAAALVYRIAHEHPQPLRSRGVHVGGDLDALVLSCLAKEPAERPATGEDLAEALRQVAAGLRDEDRARSVSLGPQTGTRLRAYRTPFVGRKAEIAELQARLNAAAAGECQLVLVEGDAGSGKSRLLGELERLATVRELRVLHGRFTDLPSALPYQGFCELIQDYFRAGEEASSPSTPDLADLAPDLLTFFPVFSEVEALRAHSSGEGTLTAPRALQGTEATYVFELFARTLIRLAGGRPLVVLLENLHAGEVSLDALGYIVHRLGPTPTLFVGTCRTEEVGRGHGLKRLAESFEGDRRFRRLKLGPLTADELRQLLELELDAKEIDGEIVQRILRATEGNPFFTRELVRSLVESEDLRRDASGVWRLRSKSSVVRDALPETVQQTVKKRLQRLDETRRRVLTVASVLGRSFEYEDLEALLGDVGELDDMVDGFLEDGLLEEDRRSRGDRLSFTSAVVADALYRELPRRRRRKLHRQHAERLEDRHAGHLERVHPQLVHHFSEAEVAEKTVRYGVEMARYALASFSPEEALVPARTALELLDDEEIADAALVRGELLFLIARAEHLAGRLEEAVYEAERAVKALEETGAPSQAAAAALFLAETAWQGRRGKLARRWIERGHELARGEEARDTLHGLLTLGATLANLRGEYGLARSYLDQAAAAKPAVAGQEDEATVPEGGILVTVLPNPVATFDPAELKTDEELEVAATLYDTLLAIDETGALTPRLCEAWKGAADGRAFELTLRPDVSFSDGSPLRAGDVKASFERCARNAAAAPAPASAALDGFQEFLDGTPGDPGAVRASGEYPVLSGLDGFRGLLGGERRGLRGIEAPDERRVIFRLREPLPIFPTLLTDWHTAIVKERAVASGPPELVGTGPFVLAAYDTERIRLRRNPRSWHGAPARLEEIEFRMSLDAAGIAAGLRAGEIDLGRDLLPADLEEILRDPTFRPGLVEATKKNVYVVVFNSSGPLTRNPSVRRALAGVVRTQDLVWRSLGRFAQPAAGLIPPGILGHDPGRRPRRLAREEARSLLRESELGVPVELRAAIHPLLQNRYDSLTRALLAEWSALGVEIVNRTPTMESYLAAMSDSRDVDLLIGRWVADYGDPDTFTAGLFGGRSGALRTYFSSDRFDELLAKGRQETRTDLRQGLYQEVQNYLMDQECALVPLFHDVDYRIAHPRVRGLRLHNTGPYVNYATMGKSETEPDRESVSAWTERRPARGGEIHVPLWEPVDTLDPTAGVFIEHREVSCNVFEPLVSEDHGRVVPWLAEVFEARQGGGEYYVRLREGIRFHDGRRLTARDVRYSFERILRAKAEEAHLPALPIRGARAVQRGEARDLAGLRILSATELLIELEEPLTVFPALLTSQVTAIVPEGAGNFRGSWREGCVGTGAFRVLRFDPGKRIELERNPEHWRPDFPKSDRLVFHLGISPEKVIDDFRQGRLTLVSNLRPADYEELRRTPEMVAGYREIPQLATYFLALNVRQGPFADAGLRQDFASAFDFEAVVRETGGRSTLLAAGLIPPGLLGEEAVEPRKPFSREVPEAVRNLQLRVVALPAYARYDRFWKRLLRLWSDAGIQLEVVQARTLVETTAAIAEGAVDLVAYRWIADYPDADRFIGRILHAEGGRLRSFCGTPEIDRLIEAGRREADPSLRHSIYREIEETIAREALLIPLFHEQTYRFCRPGVEGLRLTFGTPEVRYDELFVAP